MKNSIGMLGDLMMLLGVIFIFLGFLCRRYRNIHAKYKGRAEATVVEIVAGHPDEKGRQEGVHNYFYPVFAYYADGVLIRKRYRYGSNPCKFVLNQKVNIRYKISNPSIFIIERGNYLETGKNPLLSWDFPGSCRNIYFYFICQPKMVDVVYHTVLYLTSMN